MICMEDENMKVETSQNVGVEEETIQLPKPLISMTRRLIESYRKYGFESVEEFVAEAVRKYILKFEEKLSAKMKEKETQKTNEANVKITVEMPKEAYEFFKEYFEWAGYEFDEGVIKLLIWSVEADLDNVRGTSIPKCERLWRRIQELKRNVMES